MTKKKSATRSAALLEKLEVISQRAPDGGEDEDTSALIELAHIPIGMAPDTSKTLRMKKFRSQLLHRWLVSTFRPCRVADIGGGKGLVSYLLQQSGWDAAVIDPYEQALPDKYKDIITGARARIDPAASVPRIAAEFEVELAEGFDLLVGMHAHGCNVKIIDAAARFGCGLVIFPCCVIDEPFYPPIGVHWLESLAGYAVQKGLRISPFRLNFKGQNIGLCYPGTTTKFASGA